MNTALIEAIGWIAALFTLGAYSMRTMLPLRVFGVMANIAFAAYGALVPIYPTLVLHLVLLPFNLWRLWEILRQTRQMKAARAAGSSDLSFLSPLLRRADVPASGYLFRKGDPAGRIYYISEGRVQIEELGKELGPGELVGEIAFFTNAKTRTQSVRCLGPCEILYLDEATFSRLYNQNPAFGMHVTRLIAQRLVESEAARDPVTPPPACVP